MDPELRLVYSYLDKDINENALFLCERLRALRPDDLTWVHLQSLCCLRLGRYGLAADYSRDDGIHGRHLGCSYTFARSCLHRKQYADGILALKRAGPLWEASKRPADEHSPSGRFLPDFSSIHLLLGKLHKANGDKKLAANHFVAALESDPFMWDAFTNLCDIGATLCILNIFSLANDGPNKSSQSKSVQPATSALDKTSSTTRRGISRNRRPLNPCSRDHSQQPTHASANNPQVKGEREATVDSVEKGPAMNSLGKPLQAPPKKRHRSVADHVSTETSDFQPASTRDENDVFVSRPASSSLSPAPQRRSARLLNQGTAATGSLDRPAVDSGAVRDTLKRSTKSRNPPRPVEQKASGTSRQVSDCQTTKAATNPTLPTPESVNPPDCTALQPLLGLFETIGLGYYHLSRFELRACLDAFSSLPTEQQATPWVLSKVGRAQYELMSYGDAKSTFQALRKVAPAWMEDLEVYSTILWHLKEDVALAGLAHDLSESHYLSPQTWCAVGNSFSLQRDRHEAVRCFRRASQLEPQLARAFSLLGYEHLEMEEYGEATTAFRRALQIDARHYLAWVGLGRVREKLGEHDKALKHYLAAEKINRSNAILMTYIANALEKLGKHRQALGYLGRGLKLDPQKTTVAMIKSQAAGIYLRLGQPTNALQELQAVAQIAPGEARVHFLLGQVYTLSGSGTKDEALRAYTIALSLAPWSEEIKLAMAALEGDS